MPDSLNIILYSGAFDRIHYGLMLASAAAVTNRKVTVLVTMAACHAFTKQGFSNLVLSDGVANIPAKTSVELDNYYKQQGIATFSDLLEACALFKVEFLVCEMGLRAAQLKRTDLEASLKFSESGIVTLLNASSGGGNILFI